MPPALRFEVRYLVITPREPDTIWDAARTPLRGVAFTMGLHYGFTLDLLWIKYGLFL